MYLCQSSFCDGHLIVTFTILESPLQHNGICYIYKLDLFIRVQEIL